MGEQGGQVGEGVAPAVGDEDRVTAPRHRRPAVSLRQRQTEALLSLQDLKETVD